jgi:predicted nuclease of predicted toxin-antitoxin system
MKFKLDENFGTRTVKLFRQSGHEVKTVRDQSLQGSSDQTIYEVCCGEQLCLVTLDLDFSNVIRFPPEKAGGIAVIRTPKNPTLTVFERLINQFLKTISKVPINKQLCIVEMDRIRVHQTGEGED